MMMIQLLLLLLLEMELYSIPIVGIIGLAVLCSHPIWFYFAVAYFLGIVLYLCCIFTSDGDILLMLYEKFGRTPGKEICFEHIP